mmetsp:Transcript_86272/g.105858  ORF Transcript_86272/g.105858 Transcript_86272/m.105858 type:complete len:164 (+) Transcript_86272:2-493(+)
MNYTCMNSYSNMYCLLDESIILSPIQWPITLNPTNAPSIEPTLEPTQTPTYGPTSIPTMQPSIIPTNYPTSIPSNIPSLLPSDYPTILSKIPPKILNEKSNWIAIIIPVCVAVMIVSFCGTIFCYFRRKMKAENYFERVSREIVQLNHDSGGISDGELTENEP